MFSFLGLSSNGPPPPRESATALRVAGRSAQSLKTGGYTALEAIHAGYAMADITAAGYTAEDFNSSLREAVAEWKTNRSAALQRFGPIATWNVSEVTSMQALFRNDASFNEDLSAWDVRQVRDMRQMFEGAAAFQPQCLVRWDVSPDADVTGMFSHPVSPGASMVLLPWLQGRDALAGGTDRTVTEAASVAREDAARGDASPVDADEADDDVDHRGELEATEASVEEADDGTSPLEDAELHLVRRFDAAMHLCGHEEDAQAALEEYTAAAAADAAARRTDDVSAAEMHRHLLPISGASPTDGTATTAINVTHLRAAVSFAEARQRQLRDQLQAQYAAIVAFQSQHLTLNQQYAALTATLAAQQVTQAQERQQPAALQRDHRALEGSVQEMDQHQRALEATIDRHESELTERRAAAATAATQLPPSPLILLPLPLPLTQRPQHHPTEVELLAQYAVYGRRIHNFLRNVTAAPLGPESLGDAAVVASYLPQLLAAVWRLADERVQLFLLQTLQVTFGVSSSAAASFLLSDRSSTRPPMDHATNAAFRDCVTYLQRRGVEDLLATVAQEVASSVRPSSAIDHDVDTWMVAHLLRSPEALWLHQIVETLRARSGPFSPMSSALEGVVSLYTSFVRWILLSRCREPHRAKLLPAMGTELPHVTSALDVHARVAAGTLGLVNGSDLVAGLAEGRPDRDPRTVPAKAFVTMPALWLTETETETATETATERPPCCTYVVVGDAELDELQRFVASYVPQRVAQLQAVLCAMEEEDL